MNKFFQLYKTWKETKQTPRVRICSFLDFLVETNQISYVLEKYVEDLLECLDIILDFEIEELEVADKLSNYAPHLLDSYYNKFLYYIENARPPGESSSSDLPDLLTSLIKCNLDIAEQHFTTLYELCLRHYIYLTVLTDCFGKDKFLSLTKQHTKKILNLHKKLDPEYSLLEPLLKELSKNDIKVLNRILPIPQELLDKI